MYCDTCDSLMIHKTDDKGNIIFVCPDCEVATDPVPELEETFLVSEKIDHKENDRIEIVEDNFDVNITQEIREELRELYRESMSSIN